MTKEKVVNKDRKERFHQWVRQEIQSQAGYQNNVTLDDFSKDGMTEYQYPISFTVCGDFYSWSHSLHHTRSRYLTMHYELWFHGKCFKEQHEKISTGFLTKSKMKKGLWKIFDYYFPE